ncbi:MAG: PilZ domain-containing protein [Planctomycetes bacterium]|nr:PilZ domain-containing protein [Planctomycetota bacterium]
MDPAILERRAHPRTHAFVPTTIRHESQDEQIPVHMLDLSAGGAGLMAGAESAPNLGQYLYLRFETNDGDSEGKPREELALVVNVRRPEDGIARVGVRFIHRTDLGTTRRGPCDLLLDHRKSMKKKGGLSGDRWSFLKGTSTQGAGQAALSGVRS